MPTNGKLIRYLSTTLNLDSYTKMCLKAEGPLWQKCTFLLAGKDACALHVKQNYLLFQSLWWRLSPGKIAGVKAGGKKQCCQIRVHKDIKPTKRQCILVGFVICELWSGLLLIAVCTSTLRYIDLLRLLSSGFLKPWRLQAPKHKLKNSGISHGSAVRSILIKPLDEVSWWTPSIDQKTSNPITVEGPGAMLSPLRQGPCRGKSL